MNLTVDLSDNIQKLRSIDYLSNFGSTAEKMTKLRKLLKQDVICKNNKKQYDSSYKDLQALEFNIKLSSNYYASWNSMYICLSIKINKKYKC